MRTVALALMFVAVLLGGTSAADYYATKADYKAGKLTPGPELPKGSGSSCRDDLVEIVPPLPFVHNGDTTGSLSTVDTLPDTCTGYTTVPGPDDIFTFTISSPGCPIFTVSTDDDRYDPSIYLLSTCGDSSTCGDGWGSDRCWAANDQDNPCRADSTESFSIQGLAPSTYFFYVDSFFAPGNSLGRDSGQYNLVVTRVLSECVPVELLHFSVE